MKKGISNLIRFVLVFIIIATLGLCIFWFPLVTEHICATFANSEIINIELSEALVYALEAVIALPLFVVSILAFHFPKAIENDSIFSQKTSTLLRLISLIILWDCVFFAFCIIMLFLCGELLLSLPLAFVSVIGITVAIMLFVLSDYVKRAYLLKEEVDHTL